MAVPDIAHVLALPGSLEQVVPPSAIDQNLHMNITEYFKVGVIAPWVRLTELGVGDDYIPRRGLSFFMVEQHIRYLSELRLDDRFDVHVGIAERTAKALHAVSFVVDLSHERVACMLEIAYVHVSMESRRAVSIPDDVAAALDAEIAVTPWLPAVATGLTLRRSADQTGAG